MLLDFKLVKCRIYKKLPTSTKEFKELFSDMKYLGYVINSSGMDILLVFHDDILGDFGVLCTSEKLLLVTRNNDDNISASLCIISGLIMQELELCEYSTKISLFNTIYTRLLRGVSECSYYDESDSFTYPTMEATDTFPYLKLTLVTVNPFNSKDIPLMYRLIFRYMFNNNIRYGNNSSKLKKYIMSDDYSRRYLRIAKQSQSLNEL